MTFFFKTRFLFRYLHTCTPAHLYTLPPHVVINTIGGAFESCMPSTVLTTAHYAAHTRIFCTRFFCTRFFCRMSSYDIVVVGSTWTSEETKKIAPGLDLIAGVARQYKTKQTLNNVKAAALQSTMPPENFANILKLFQAMRDEVDRRVGSVAVGNTPENGNVVDIEGSDDEPVVDIDKSDNEHVLAVVDIERSDNKDPKGDIDELKNAVGTFITFSTSPFLIPPTSSFLSSCPVPSPPPSSCYTLSHQMLTTLTMYVHHSLVLYFADVMAIEAAPTTQALVSAVFSITLRAFLPDKSPTGAPVVVQYQPPCSASSPFLAVVKNVQVLCVYHVNTNTKYENQEEFCSLVLHGGDQEFHVVVRPLLKGGGLPPTVWETLAAGSNQCMAFFEGIMYPVVIDADFAHQIIKNGEEMLLDGLKDNVSLPQQIEDYKGQLRMIVAAVVHQDDGNGDINEAAASIGLSEKKMTSIFFLDVAALLKVKAIPNDNDNGFLFMGGSTKNSGTTPQFNVASNGSMLPGCVSVVAEKSDTLRIILQKKNLSVPDDCMVMGNGVPVNFNVDTAFGDVVTKNMTFELVHRRRGGAPSSFVCPITGTTMTDPVFTSDGHCYEREAIQEWLKTNNTSPLTMLVLEHKRLTTAWAVKSAIAEEVASHGGGAAAAEDDDKEMSDVTDVDEEMSTEEASNTVRLVPEDSDSAESSDEEEGGGAAAAQGHSMDHMSDGAPSTWYACDRAHFVHFYEQYFLPFTARQAASVEWTAAQKRAHYRQWAANPVNQFALKHNYNIQLSGNSSNEDILDNMHKLRYVPKDKRASYRRWMMSVEKNEICDGQNLPRESPQVREVDIVYSLYNNREWSRCQDDAP